jgi:mRNA interferase MazF
MYQRGDIVSISFPYTDQSTTKIRPALIISNDIVNETGDIVIVMVTSKNKNDFFQIEIGDSDTFPILPKTSFIRCHRIITIQSNLVLEVISHANENLLKVVENKIQSLICTPNNQVENIMVNAE